MLREVAHSCYLFPFLGIVDILPSMCPSALLSFRWGCQEMATPLFNNVLCKQPNVLLRNARLRLGLTLRPTSFTKRSVSKLGSVLVRTGTLCASKSFA